MPDIYVDVDNTLLCSAGWEFHPCVRQACRKTHRLWDLARMSVGDLQEAVCGPDERVTMSPKGLLYISTLRPNAREFCRALRGMAKRVYALTAADTEYQRRILASHGMDKLLDGVYGQESFGSTVGSGPAILVDDCDPMHPRTVTKIDCMGVHCEKLARHAGSISHFSSIRKVMDMHYVGVSPFMGDPRDDGLMGLIPAIEAKLKALE